MSSMDIIESFASVDDFFARPAPVNEVVSPEENDELEVAYLPPEPVRMPEASVEELTPEERIAVLFDSMPQQRRVLTDILAMCATEQPIEDVEAEIDRVQHIERSVYGSATLCGLLKRAGALELLGEVEDVEPDEVEEDGGAYLRPQPEQELRWLTTPEGTAFLQLNHPDQRLFALIDEDPRYTRIYATLLELCSADGGATRQQMSDAVDGDPVLQKPRLFCQRFYCQLSDCDCIEWNGDAWVATEVGRSLLPTVKERADAEECAASSNAA